MAMLSFLGFLLTQVRLLDNEN